MLENINEDQLDLIISLLQTYFLYVAVALAVAIGAIALVIMFTRPESMKKFLPVAVGITLGVAITVIFTIMSLTLARYTIKGRINTNFWLVTALIIAIILMGTVAYVLKLVDCKAFKPFMLASIAAIAIYSAVLTIVLPSKSGYEAQNPALFYTLTALLVVALVLIAFIGKPVKVNDTRSITYAAVCLATSFALSYIKFFTMPQEGSVTLASFVPIMLYAYMFGTKKGVIVGVIYGFLQFMQSPQVYQPIQLFVDYPIAFGFVGAAGLFRGRIKNIHSLEFTVGAIITTLLRYASHVIAGVFVFYSYAGDQAPLLYSLAYNSFVFVDIAIALVVSMLLFASKGFRAQLDKVMLPADKQSEINQ